MKLELAAVTKGPEARILAPTTATVHSGEAVLVEAETEQRPTVLGLVASGRMRQDSGTVRINGVASRRALRRACALVDAPSVSEPDPNILTIGVVIEELMFAGKTANPITARRWLTEHGFADLARVPIGQVTPVRRIRLLCALAATRPGVEAIVLVSPDRHGGRPQKWWRVVDELAATGLAVLVIAGRASWEVLYGGDPDALASSADPHGEPGSETEQMTAEVEGIA